LRTALRTANSEWLFKLKTELNNTNTNLNVNVGLDGNKPLIQSNQIILGVYNQF
jgi:hypothetical protein